MSSSVYQGLQTCLEPRLAEPRVLRLKLAPPPSTAAANGNDMGGWSFLQCLDNANSNSSIQKDEKVYVHPLAKRSASKLSPKSLAMCTESLGSETGSESGDDISMLSLESTRRIERTERSDLTMSKKQSRSEVAFPPPLTSISGSSGVRVRPHREGGRLILKAVNVSPPTTNLHSERSNGRLRIRLLAESSQDSVSEQETEYIQDEDQETEEPNQETEYIQEEDQETEFIQENDQETEGVDQETEYIQEHDQETEHNHQETEYIQEDDQETEHIQEDEVVSENEGEGGYWGGEMGRNFESIGGKIGIENFQRPRSRCKEGGQGNNGFLNKNWESHFGWLLKPICLS